MALQTAQSTRLILRCEQDLHDKMSYNILSCNVQLLPLTRVGLAASHVSRIGRTYLDLLKSHPRLSISKSVNTPKKHSDLCMQNYEACRHCP
jgi:hypothetical protein